MSSGLNMSFILSIVSPVSSFMTTCELLRWVWQKNGWAKREDVSTGKNASSRAPQQPEARKTISHP